MRTSGRQSVAMLALWLAPFLLPAGVRDANAQDASASIIGQVKDESGAVLPGVMVSATGPALQVPQVDAVTNENGEYRLTRLPIGIYAVQYELSGFQTVRRGEIRLTLGFTATIDTVLKIGNLVESVTVTSASPVVDVATTTTQTRFMREELDELPTTRNSVLSLTTLAPGVRTAVGNFDVGGSHFTSGPALNSFGRPGDEWKTLDGVVTNSGSNGTGGVYWDFGNIEEAAVQTTSKTAEVPWNGTSIASIVKSGGNTYHGSAYYALTGPWAQSKNVDARLASLGITTGNKLLKRYDSGGDIGGKFVKDKVWFYGGARRSFDDSEVAGAAPQPSGAPADAFKLQVFWTAKLSYQMTKNHRLIGLDQFNSKDIISGVDRFHAWESRSEQYQAGHSRKIEWQGVFGNALSVSALSGYHNYDTIIHDFAGSKVATYDEVLLTYTGQQISPFVAPYRPLDTRYTTTGRVTWFRPNFIHGSHEFKAGADYLPSVRHARYDGRANGADYYLVFRNNVPNFLVTYNLPVDAVSNAGYYGAFVQDNWAVHRRLTINAGLRFDQSPGNVPAQAKAKGTFVAPTNYPSVAFPTWGGISPRLSVAFDLTGRAETVLKAGYAKYNRTRFVGDIEPANEGALRKTQYFWHDVNGNKTFDPGEVNFDTSGPDFIRVTSSAGAGVNGSTGVSVRVPNADELTPKTDEFSVAFEHQLMPNFAIRVSGNYAVDSNLRQLDGLGQPFSSYTIPITRPDNGPDNIAGTADDPGRMLTYYEYSQALQGAAFITSRNATVPDARNIYKAFEVSATKRTSHRWQMLATYGRIWKDLDLRNDLTPLNPNSMVFADDRTVSWYGKIAATYHLPWGMLTSTNFNAVSGEPYSRTVSLSGGRTIPSIVLPTEPWGARSYPNAYLVDWRIEKRVELPRGQKVAIRADVFNATNSNVVTTLTTQSGANFERPTAILPGRIVIVNCSYSF
jgi:hypothetical protein